MKTWRLLVCLLAIPAAAHAAPITFAGYLDNAASLSPAGGQLVDFLLGPADLTVFPDQNVALFEFTVAAPTTYTVTSRGYRNVYSNTPGVDGFDAYISLFQGTGSGAVWTDEFFNPIAAGDFQDTTAVLGAGTYTLAIAMWQNYACGNGACFPTTGTLGDGFSGLSTPEFGRDLYFEVDLEAAASGGPTPVPEPATLTLVALGAARFARRRHVTSRDPRSTSPTSRFWPELR